MEEGTAENVDHKVSENCTRLLVLKGHTARYDALFSDTHPYVNEDWAELTIENILTIHMRAVRGILRVSDNEFRQALEKHLRLHPIIQRLREIIGWKLPKAISRREIIIQMAERLDTIARWQLKFMSHADEKYVPLQLSNVSQRLKWTLPENFEKVIR